MYVQRVSAAAAHTINNNITLSKNLLVGPNTQTPGQSDTAFFILCVVLLGLPGIWSPADVWVQAAVVAVTRVFMAAINPPRLPPSYAGRADSRAKGSRAAQLPPRSAHAECRYRACCR